MPAGKLAAFNASGAFTVRVSGLVAVTPRASVTVAVNGKEPGALGTPRKLPEEARTRPSTFCVVKESVPLPPVAAMVCE